MLEWLADKAALPPRKAASMVRWLPRALARAVSIESMLDKCDADWDSDSCFIVYGFTSDRYNAKTIAMLQELGEIPLEQVTWPQEFFPKFRLETTCRELSHRNRRYLP